MISYSFIACGKLSSDGALDCSLTLFVYIGMYERGYHSVNLSVEMFGDATVVG